jgi:hypothetical protein
MLTIEVPRVDSDPTAQRPIVADRRLYLTEDREIVVEPGDEKAAWLFCAPGHSIPGSEVTRLALVVVDGRVTQPRSTPAPSIDPSRTDDELLSQFFGEAVDAGYTEEASTSLAEGRLRDLRAGGTGGRSLAPAPETK